MTADNLRALAEAATLRAALTRLERVATAESGLLDTGWLGGEFAAAIIEARAALAAGEVGE